MIMSPENRLRRLSLAASAFVAILAAAVPGTAQSSPPSGGYQELVALYEEWREFERPATRDGAPDYTAAAMAKKHAELKDYPGAAIGGDRSRAAGRSNSRSTTIWSGPR